MPSRRPVLAAAASLLTAGCLGPVRSLAGNGDDCVSGFSVTAGAFRPPSELPVRLSASQRRLVDRLLRTQTAEVTTYGGDPPLRDGVYAKQDATYYRTAVARAGTTDVPAHRLDITWEAGREAPTDAAVVAFTELPQSDQRALRLAVRGPKYGERRGHPREGLSVRDAPMPYPNGTGDSRFVTRGETWVRWNDRTYRVTSGDPATTTRYTYRCSLTAVADGARSFRDHVVEQYLIPLSDVTDAERTILEQATADGYQECDPGSDGLERLRKRLPDDRRLPHPYDDSWFVQFDGNRYELDITNWIK